MLIVSYDFTNNKTRSKFAKFLKKYGRRMQYSVFSVHNSPRVLRNILTEIEAKYKKLFTKTDSIVIFPVCEGCRGKTIRYGSAHHDIENVVYFG
ncbi:CRISPR-associated endonuclease Cas2 [Candidatus Gottesmanbacteria bacterium CG11_big_fil_rev_8_21_14_0_20_37_11]|uniref:CRISPR-associated endoribonuclease Cas2 n=3 Tax=Candidatus Gottesmaniibacteriota TaxID=1752720 RepID=A0A2M7RRA7_9BACT|nr:MAG: CRISPR-associated endonuclease Cas2 [Candidatus Gottesmanbacteria bacterium CG1_02_37_22]PIP32529.1 MAG: CRISPR-associated endonuclease Cas2 [Candidatus Gottesmanbacteria bacterium CG23_combo_of_CG06-09_8_20_14_all_37_19]PIR07833.1 MAG: CRISPR-associated endonuclease Cas2 [Candidatus Gottesmanbacteria bacterium CG11_big_fil_rev_8_21_14_0_20_37_11]PIZ02851.1 MAG: CRISPR-associated endonuclease Cas2 [Candidatus Gottesmanbacteria bacterium CG_4_10_14_0_8_um_filter_37_24]